MLPHAFLKAAAQHHASVKAQTIGGKRYNVVTFMGLNKASVNGYIGADNLIDRVETTIDNAVLGDMPFEALYSDYRDYGGIKFPTHIVQKQGGYPILDLTVSEVKPTAAVTIQPPQGRGGAPAATAPATSGTPSEKLADGIYLIAGGYGSVAVEMKDHVVVIEGPQSDERAVAVIAETKRL